MTNEPSDRISARALVKELKEDLLKLDTQVKSETQVVQRVMTYGRMEQLRLVITRLGGDPNEN